VSENKTAALQYLRLGLHPIPCEVRGKRPLVPWKNYQATPPTEEQIERWWTETPDANVGLILGRGTFAVDIDSDAGYDALLEQGCSLAAPHPISRTAKGAHHLFAAPGPVPDRVGLVEGVDIRGVGYIVAPPSIHPSGQRYEWIVPFEGALPPAPRPLLTLIAGPQQRPAASDPGWVVTALAGVGEGQRDQVCTRLAGYFLQKHVTPDVVEAILQDWALRCTPAFAPDAVTKCVASIARRAAFEEESTEAQVTSLGEVLDTLLVSLQSPQRGAVALPYPELEEFIAGGFMPGELVYLGARPGVGKTALALEIAHHAARQGTGVLFCSREMMVAHLAQRLIAQDSLVTAQQLRSRSLDGTAWTAIHASALRMRGLPFWLTDSAVTIEQIAQSMEHYATSVGLLVIDYLQLIRSPREYAGDRRAAIEHVSKELKTLGVRYGVPVLCLSSLRRLQRDGEKDPKPSLADLRESGELEHDADVVILLHRKPAEDRCEFIIAKARDGRAGTITLTFRGEHLSFAPLAAA